MNSIDAEAELITNRPGLLVSVANVTEAVAVRNANVDILDIKDPGKGSLGCPEWEVVEKILQIPVRTNQLTSVALGELDAIDFKLQEFIDSVDPGGLIRFVKFGLAGAVGFNWKAKYQSLFDRQVPQIRPVIAAYVDHGLARSPRIDQVIDFAIDADISVILLDTFEKTAGDFFRYVDYEQFLRWRNRANHHDKLLVVAGSINRFNLQQAIDLLPNVIGVRGGVAESENRINNISTASLDRFLEGFERMKLSKKIPVINRK